jgi:hypothetical protein
MLITDGQLETWSKSGKVPGDCIPDICAELLRLRVDMRGGGKWLQETTQK